MLFGTAWLPLFCSRLRQRTRSSPKEATTCSESSVHASPITKSSRLEWVCQSTERIACRRTLLQLYVAITTLTRGRPSTTGSA